MAAVYFTRRCDFLRALSIAVFIRQLLGEEPEDASGAGLLLRGIAVRHALLILIRRGELHRHVFCNT